MATWFFILLSVCISALIKSFINILFPYKKQSYKLPPGPFSFPIIGNALILRKPIFELESVIRDLHRKFGPIITLHYGFKPIIFIADSSLAHKALIQNGAVFADKPPASAVMKVASTIKINSAAYGPTWRLLRRNLKAEILHPVHVKSYSHVRKWVLQILLDGLNFQVKNGNAITVVDHFQFAMFCLLVLMCFGEKLDEKKIKEVEDVMHLHLLSTKRLYVLNFLPKVTKFLFRKQWKEFFQITKKIEGILMPLVRERRNGKEEVISKAKEGKDDYVLAYVDTLFDLQLPDEERKLDEKEIMSLCMEFLNAGSVTTTTVLQWIMAYLVKYPHIQEKLFAEIKGVVGDAERELKEEYLHLMPYLKAVILETLRLHPPLHFLPPHAVTDDVVLDGFLVPKNATILFMTVDMGRHSKIWDDPMAFKPERFLHKDENGEQAFDVTGSREIKMMPFGAGRRICAGIDLAMLHLEYFVANLIWCYEWKPSSGNNQVNFEEKQEVTVMMKYPLRAIIYPRSK